MVTSAGSAHVDTMIVTAGKAYAKGDFYIQGGISGICIDAIANGEKGTIQTAGVFADVQKDQDTKFATTLGAKVAAKDGDHLLYSSGGKTVGFAMERTTNNDETVDIVLNFGGSL